MRFTSVRASLAASTFVALAIVPSAIGGCSSKEPKDTTYFDRTISPILTTSCVRTNTGAGCHVSDPKGYAFGNLDTSTFEGVNHRRDLLLNYGPYGQPAFLVKNVPGFQVEVQSFDGNKVTITTDIKHVGGPILDPTASGYQTLRRWIENGATANNTGIPPLKLERRPCSTFVPSAVGFDPTKDPTRPDFQMFVSGVNPVIHDTCSASNCHGTASNDLYLTCGDTPEMTRWNYFAASDYLSQTPEQSEIVRRPLSPAQGGSFHEGGVIFTSATDPQYLGILSWVKAHGPPDFGAIEPNFAFFAHKVQPVLVKKGCMMLQCHSAAMFHDYRLRGGAGGSFSLSATRRNYQLSLAQLSLESEDVNASRMVRKNLFRPELGGEGITHRGGPLLEDFNGSAPAPMIDAGPEGGAEGGTPPAAPGAGSNATGALCDAKAYNYDTDNLDIIPAYCVIREWHKRERIGKALAPLSAIIYVKRAIPSGPDRVQDFDVYAPGADLRIAEATLTAAGSVTLGADASATAGCGLDPTTADIRRPVVSWDGKTVAFAARASAAEPLQIYQMNADGKQCAKHVKINEGPSSVNGILVHNFDPAFSPPDDGGGVHLVFASTRGNLATAPYDYAGPQRTPADPSKPNANLYIHEPDPAAPGQNRIRQGTFLLNTEREPSFMSDGRMIFTAEKRSPGFYQLALRRMNVDGGDYHPLFAQRSSIGYHEASHAVELADKNFAAIFSDPGASHGGGTLGVFNRSLGIDFGSTNAADYLVEASVLDPASKYSVEPAFFLHSLRFPDPNSSGHPMQATMGVYTSPAALPGERMLVSFGVASDAATFGGDYDLYELDPATGLKTKILGDAGKAEVDAVAVYARASRGVFKSTLDEPNGHTTVFDGKTEADINYLDVPVLASLLFQNTPTGRPIEALDSIDLYEDLPPTSDVTSYAAGGASVVKDEFGQVYVRKRRLGQVPLGADGSAHVQVPGGLPIFFKMPETPQSMMNKLPRVQRESFTFAPGEYAHQSFKRDFFSGLCGNCHGSISGRPLDIAVQPDILTQASDTLSRGSQVINLNGPPSGRGMVEGP